VKKLIYLSILILTGCATPQMYNPKSINTQDLSNVRTLSGTGLFLTAEYSAYILYIHDVNNKEITNRNALSTQINDISLPAGRYHFQVSCRNKWYHGSAAASFKVEPSKNYEITCAVTKGKNFLGISVDSTVHLEIKELV